MASHNNRAYLRSAIGALASKDLEAQSAYAIRALLEGLDDKSEILWACTELLSGMLPCCFILLLSSVLHIVDSVR